MQTGRQTARQAFIDLWQNGKPLVWDVTVVSTLADSYVAAKESGLVAEQTAERIGQIQ